MSTQHSRRDLLRGTLAVTGLGLLGFPEWALPVLAQGETLVPFTDLPPTFNPTPRADHPARGHPEDRRSLHAEGPVLHDAALRPPDGGRRGVSSEGHRPGQPDAVAVARRPEEDEAAATFVAGFECSGNRRPFQGLASNGKWTGIPLKAVLDKAGVKAEAREFVFFGADKGEEEVEFRAEKFKVEQQFGRALPREKALAPEPFLAWELNGEPLTVHQGFPLRLIVPGWYGVANVKWLSQIHLQKEEYLGKYQARWYRTLRGEMIDGQTIWKESAVTLMQLKSFIARVTQGRRRAQGARRRAQRRHAGQVGRGEGRRWPVAGGDGGRRRRRTSIGWKLYTFTWNGATAGEHTLVSRMTDDLGPRPADRRRDRQQENLPRRQLAAPAEADHRVSRRENPGRRSEIPIAGEGKVAIM